jgi:hypothetical protein
MRRLRIGALSLMLLIILGASTTGVASAEEGFLPRLNPKFKISAKNFLFEDTNGIGVICTTLEGSASLENDKHASMTLSLIGCKSGLFAANSLGDPSERILAPVLLLVCLITPATLTFGLSIETTNGPLHIEEPALGALVDLAGRVIAQVLTIGPALKFITDLIGKKGAENVKECSDSNGAKTWTLTSEINHNGKALLTSVKIEGGLLTFEEAQQLMDT